MPGNRNVKSWPTSEPTNINYMHGFRFIGAPLISCAGHHLPEEVVGAAVCLRRDAGTGFALLGGLGIAIGLERD